MKTGRNTPCPCGSGKKYKRCCIDKLSQVEVEEMYLQQLEITKNINSEKSCLAILEIGSKIISANQQNECMTGTYVNMAVAKRMLFYLTGVKNELIEAKQYCNAALKLKSSNQVALRILFGICLDLEDYDIALETLQLYEITDVSNPMSIEIIREYQNAISAKNSSAFLDENKALLDKITDLIFKKFGYNTVTYGVTMIYYQGIGNDVLKAYEFGKKCVEDYPNSETYNNIGLICLTDKIKRKEDAEKYFLKAIELESDEKKKLHYKGNHFLALMESEKYEKAEELILDLIENNPCNQNFSNYSEFLKRLGRYEEALIWGRKALFLVEDDTTLLIVADIYTRKKDYTKAVEMYQLCLGHLNAKENVYKFSDHNQSTLYSIATNNSMDSTLYEVFRRLISVNFTIRDLESAKIYLNVAQQKLPYKNDWDIWNQTLPEVEVSIQKKEKIEKQLKDAEDSVRLQKEFIRSWAEKLLKLQNNSKHLNLDESNEWESYQKEMDIILQDMEKTINKDSLVYQSACNFVNSKFPNLNEKSKKFLITAEVLYEIHKVSVIDFAPIVIEYAKVSENQLRILLGATIPNDSNTLGSVLFTIKEKNIQPYKQYLTYLHTVNKSRKKAAHTGVLTKKDVDDIRKIYYDNNLINLLS